jgi:hypothetical protein
LKILITDRYLSAIRSYKQVHQYFFDDLTVKMNAMVKSK